MAGRAKAFDTGDNLESFNDILTCLAGVLVLIVILVVLDSKQAKILIPTPITQAAENISPVWIEVNERGELHAVPVQELYDWADAAISAAQKEHGDLALAKLAAVPATNGAYVVNLYQTAVGSGMLEIQAIRDLEGHGIAQEIGRDPKSGIMIDYDDWFERFLETVDAERSYVAFIVRSTDEAFRAFKVARARAWLDGVNVAYTLVGNREALQFAERGDFLGFQ